MPASNEGVTMETIKCHHIRYSEAPSDGSHPEWEARIGEVPGVDGVCVDPEKREVFVEYDLLRCCEEAIESRMEKMGFVLETGFLQRVKRGWIHYTEENELDALRAKEGHPCCGVEELERKKRGLK